MVDGSPCDESIGFEERKLVRDDQLSYQRQRETTYRGVAGCGADGAAANTNVSIMEFEE